MNVHKSNEAHIRELTQSCNEREREGQTDRQTERDREIQRQRDRDRQRDREKESEFNLSRRIAGISHTVSSSSYAAFRHSAVCYTA